MAFIDPTAANTGSVVQIQAVFPAREGVETMKEASIVSFIDLTEAAGLLITQWDLGRERMVQSIFGSVSKRIRVDRVPVQRPNLSATTTSP